MDGKHMEQGVNVGAEVIRKATQAESTKNTALTRNGRKIYPEEGKAQMEKEGVTGKYESSVASRMYPGGAVAVDVKHSSVTHQMDGTMK